MSTIFASSERRRVRLIPMAKELGISDRKFRELIPLGVPHTQLGGIFWFEPAEVHAWLDKFHRKGRKPGVKRVRGVKIAKETAVQ